MFYLFHFNITGRLFHFGDCSCCVIYAHKKILDNVCLDIVNSVHWWYVDLARASTTLCTYEHILLLLLRFIQWKEERHIPNWCEYSRHSDRFMIHSLASHDEQPFLSVFARPMKPNLGDSVTQILATLSFPSRKYWIDLLGQTNEHVSFFARKSPPPIWCWHIARLSGLKAKIWHLYPPGPRLRYLL